MTPWAIRLLGIANLWRLVPWSRESWCRRMDGTLEGRRKRWRSAWLVWTVRYWSDEP